MMISITHGVDITDSKVAKEFFEHLSNLPGPNLGVLVKLTRRMTTIKWRLGRHMDWYVPENQI